MGSTTSFSWGTKLSLVLSTGSQVLSNLSKTEPATKSETLILAILLSGLKTHVVKVKVTDKQ